MLKGLILKDLYEVRISILLSFVFFAYPHILMLITPDTFISTDTRMAQDIISTMIFALLNYTTITLFSSFILNTLSTDEKTGWSKIERTMPLSNSQIIWAKLLTIFIIVSGLVLFCITFNVIIYFMTECVLNLELLIAIPVCIGLMQTTTLSLILPLAYKLGVKRSSVLYLVLTILIAIIFIIGMFAALSNDLSVTALRLIFYVGLPILSAGSVVLSWKTGSVLCGRDL